MTVSCDGSTLNVGIAVMNEWDFEGTRVKRIKGGYLVTIRERGVFNRVNHKIYYKNMEDATGYINSIAAVQSRPYGTKVTAIAPDGFMSKWDLRSSL